METHAEQRFKVFGLLMDCPNARKRNDCPLKEIRKLPTQEKEALVHSWDMQKIDNILSQHEECFFRRR